VQKGKEEDEGSPLQRKKKEEAHIINKETKEEPVRGYPSLKSKTKIWGLFHFPENFLFMGFMFLGGFV